MLAGKLLEPAFAHINATFPAWHLNTGAPLAADVPSDE